MNKFFCITFLVLLFFHSALMAQVPDYKNGKLLSRCEPQKPFAGYLRAVELAVNFWKNCSVNKDNKLPLNITHSSLYRDGKGGFFGSSWPQYPGIFPIHESDLCGVL